MQRRGRLRRRRQQTDFALEHESLPAHLLDLDGYELAFVDELLPQCRSARIPRRPRIRLGGADAAEDVAAAPDAEEAVSAVAREELVPELLRERDAALEHVGR